MICGFRLDSFVGFPDVSLWVSRRPGILCVTSLLFQLSTCLAGAAAGAGNASPSIRVAIWRSCEREPVSL